MPDIDTTLTKPTKKIGGMFVKVLTYDLTSADPDVPESEAEIDFTDPERRRWLLDKHMFWALNNHRTVELIARGDDE